MKKLILITMVAIMTGPIPSCKNNSDDTSVGPIPTGAYQYKSYDTTGVAIVKGWLTLNYEDSLHITGEWHLEKIGNPQNIGPQVGSGNLIGGIDQGRVWVELNPQYADNNLQLIGIIEDGYYEGEWIWLSIVGITNRGSFEAVRI
ncbi:MAG: hypothetical protein IIB95_12420 [Candidatus Marinimicrobia bacterium]|nr:hypothetical protein [Candidatus Neomarinimicrobiota bacterium]MCH7764518.1 hypothetical protein [Candidatus Neomarinimicrobiota bacterium]